MRHNAELNDSPGDRIGTVHWILIEEDRHENNATYRLDSSRVHFWATGVEI